MVFSTKRGAISKKVISAVVVSLIVIIVAFLYFVGFNFLKERDSQRRAAEYLSRADYFEKEKRWDEGIAYFEKEAKKHPDSSMAHCFLGLMYMNRGELEKAIPAAEKAAALWPGNDRAYAVLGRCYLKKADLERAKALLLQAYRLNSDQRDTCIYLADAVARRGNLKACFRYVAKAKAIDPDLDSPAYLMGLYELKNGNMVKALQYEQSAVKDDPGNTIACMLLGEIYTNMEKFDDSFKAYEKALLLLPAVNNAEYEAGLKSRIYSGMGLGYNLKNEKEKAIFYYKKAIDSGDSYNTYKRNADVEKKDIRELHPAQNPAGTGSSPENKTVKADKYYSTACNFEKDRKWDEGISYFKRESEKHPDSSKAAAFLALMHLNRKEVEKAVPLAEKAIKMNPGDDLPYSVMGRCLAMRKELDKAVIFLSKAVNLNPERLESCINLADVLARQGEMRSSTQYLIKAKGIEPGLEYPSYLMGKYEAIYQNYQKALEYEQAAIREEPDNIAAHFILGEIYSNMGRFDDSLNAYEDALHMITHTEYPRKFRTMIYYGMGLDYYWKNDQDRAIENYTMSLRYTRLKATYRRLGISYLKKGMNDEALREFRRARIGEDE